MEKIKFNEEELTQSQKLEKLAKTLKTLKMIHRDNELQITYTQQYWKKLWEYTQGHETINKVEYKELIEVTNKIAKAKAELEFLLKRMIISTIEQITDNV